VSELQARAIVAHAIVGLDPWVWEAHRLCVEPHAGHWWLI